MSKTQTYEGGCHCGEVRFEADLDLTRAVSRCNCTLCVKRSTTTMIVALGAFRLITGRATLTEYAWGGKTSHFYFCSRCGMHPFGRGYLPELGGAFVAVNVHCIDDIDPAQLTVVYFDGRHDNWHAGPRDRPWPVHAATSAATGTDSGRSAP